MNPYALTRQASIKTHISHLIFLKGTSAVQQYQSQIKVFLHLCLHQQLTFDNSLYIIHAKWFVLINEIPAGRHLEMWRNCVAVTDPHSFIAIVFIKSRDWNYNAQTSHFKMAARRKFNDQNKLLGVNYSIYRELSNLSCRCRHKLRKTLIRDQYYWKAEVPFKRFKFKYPFCDLFLNWVFKLSNRPHTKLYQLQQVFYVAG